MKLNTQTCIGATGPWHTQPLGAASSHRQCWFCHWVSLGWSPAVRSSSWGSIPSSSGAVVELGSSGLCVPGLESAGCGYSVLLSCVAGCSCAQRVWGEHTLQLTEHTRDKCCPYGEGGAAAGPARCQRFKKPNKGKS